MRAGKVNDEYRRKLVEADKECFGTPEGQDGPLLARLKSVPAVEPLVFGHVHEASDAVHGRFVSMVGNAAARHDGDRLGLSQEDTARKLVGARTAGLPNGIRYVQRREGRLRSRFDRIVLPLQLA